MAEYLFAWTVDSDGDGIPDVERYRSSLWLPDVDPPDGGRSLRVQSVETLAGEIVTQRLTRSGASDHRLPGKFTLSWEVCDPTFLLMAEEDYAKGRIASVRLDHRWRQLRVTSSGAADRVVNVAPGYWLGATDTAWYIVAEPHTCAADHTRVYATASAGAITIGSGTSVPSGGVLLAEISISGDVVTVLTDPSGVANARTCRVMEFKPRQVGGGHTGLELVLQEVR